MICVLLYSFAGSTPLARRMHPPSPMETLATVIRLVRKSTVLPAELTNALTASGDLRDAFDRLSMRQKNCYLDWIGSAHQAGDRTSRAQLVAHVVRALSVLATDGNEAA